MAMISPRRMTQSHPGEESVSSADPVEVRFLRPGDTQRSPGNARSVRTFQTAGYRAVGSEALLTAG